VGFDEHQLLGEAAPDAGLEIAQEAEDIATIPAVLTNIIFVSEGTLVSSDTNLAEADALCEQEALSAGLPGTYVALLSTTTVAARDRVGTARGWVRPDGLPVTNDLFDADSTFLYFPPTLTARGEAATRDLASLAVMTGSTATGAVEYNCNDYTESGGRLRSGFHGEVDGRFIKGMLLGIHCGLDYPVYCAGIDHQNEVSPPVPEVGRRAFVSTPTLAPAGLAGADAHCQSNAADAGLAGTFTALLGTTESTPASRLNMDGLPWVTTTGLRIIDDSPDIATRSLRTAVAYDAWGQPLATSIFTGSTRAGRIGDATCADWSSTESTDEVRTGRNSAAQQFFWGYYPGPCDREHSLLCFEE
jgi:hypothetical protein